MIYRVNAHDVLNGGTTRTHWDTKASAISAAKTYHQSGAYLWVDVVAEDRRGRITVPFHVERKATDAERAAIEARYAATTEA